MDSVLVKLVTMLPMLLHGVFGCCWHHAHLHTAGTSQVVAEAFGEDQGHRRLHACSCGGHGRLSPRLATDKPRSPIVLGNSVNDVTRGSRSEEPQPADAPCDGDRCEIDSCTSIVKLTTPDLDAAGPFSCWAETSDVLAACGPQCPAVIDNSEIVSPSTDRSRLQVWRI